MPSSSADKTKAARAAAKAARSASRKQRRQQIWQIFQIQRKEDSRLLPYMGSAFFLIVAIFVLLGIWLGKVASITLIPLGIILGVLAAGTIFSRRVQKAAYRRADGQPGAAGYVLENLRGPWRVTPTVAVTSQFDAIHRVIGRPGVILVGEGTPSRVRPLLLQEKKRTSRLVGEVPIYDIMVGHDQDQVPLDKLERYIMKLPSNIKNSQIDSLESRLTALGNRSGAAMPKGPLPPGVKARSIQRSVRRR